jgi:hypothetical protein
VRRKRQRFERSAERGGALGSAAGADRAAPSEGRTEGRAPADAAGGDAAGLLASQNWYALSDPMAEETLYDGEAMRRFAGIELGDDRIPDGPKGPWPQWGRVSPQDTILNFRHLLERHGLTEAIFAAVNAHLADTGITLRSGTLVDVSGRTPLVRVSPRKIIDAPSSTKNKAKARDPEMSSAKKGNDWYFGSAEDQQTVRGGC